MTSIAIVGAGYMGRTHAAAWTELDCEIVYVCSPSGATLTEAPGAQGVTDITTVLADPAVDIVSICTPTPTHRDLAVRALAAGKHVLLEKPIALSIGDALAISAAALASERTLMVAHVVRFFEGYRRARDDVDAGALGTVLSARARRLITKPDTAWWYDESQSGGVAVDVGIHDFDQLNLFLGTPIAVTSRSNDELGPIETTVDYASGAIGQVLTFADLPVGAPFTTSLELIGTAGLLDYDFSADAPTANETNSGVNSYRLATATGSRSETLSALDHYTRQAAYFLECVRDGTDPAYCPTASAVLALEVALAARQSLVTGETVLLEERA
ncbi:Gfo/Idh/MocA family protein [Mycetocola zhadangensis]|uniref:Gfo/Idh/MocA family oxidoreductase n=1 Tax=Mycetocola zhadangensis TaxID=1164595 RepID=A0A3L7J1B8_9MICO|nr:Gfo/Idh/MocA family oxidoreductase [Mycetocola zhadangensis]RLQ84260.1 gfo/Idh/MocA family oxidoreductase [Mycetocola zhadangensis]GGE94640.1 dehydrogenase [Mycetocola zhadangensis]